MPQSAWAPAACDNAILSAAPAPACRHHHTTCTPSAARHCARRCVLVCAEFSTTSRHPRCSVPLAQDAQPRLREGTLPKSVRSDMCPRDPFRSASRRRTDSRTQVAAHDDDHSPVASLAAQQWPPASPPPSFHSRASSPNGTSRRLLSDDPLANDEDRTLADTFDSDSDDDEDGDGRDDRQRLMRGNPPPEDEAAPRGGRERSVTELPAFNTQAPAVTGRVYGGGNGGVWANLSAKPTRGEDAEEKPPVRIYALSRHGQRHGC